MEEYKVVKRPLRAIFANSTTTALLILTVLVWVTDGFVRPSSIFDGFWYSVVPILGAEITELVHSNIYYLFMFFMIINIIVEILRVKIETVIIGEHYMQVKTGILYRTDDDIFYSHIRSVDPTQTPLEIMLGLKDYRILVDGAQSDIGVSEVISNEGVVLPQSRVTLHRMPKELYNLIQDKRVILEKTNGGIK
jgi:hypothetical protein